jgi:hypothetical protein
VNVSSQSEPQAIFGSLAVTGASGEEAIGCLRAEGRFQPLTVKEERLRPILRHGHLGNGTSDPLWGGSLETIQTWKKPGESLALQTDALDPSNSP